MDDGIIDGNPTVQSKAVHLLSSLALWDNTAMDALQLLF